MPETPVFSRLCGLLVKMQRCRILSEKWCSLRQKWCSKWCSEIGTETSNIGIGNE